MLTVVLVVVEPVKQYPGWRVFKNDWEGTDANVATVDGQLVMTLTAIAALDANWKVQVIQDAFALGIGEDNVGHMNLEAGKTYKVTFDAKASVAGNITLAIGHAGGGWTPYFVSDPLAVTTDMATFTIIFTLSDDEMDYSVPAQFKLEMGLLFAGLTAPQTFTLDNVRIDVEVDSAFVPTDLIFNGTMDEEPIDVYALPEWRYFVNFWEGTEAKLQGVNGQLVLTLMNINALDANWKVQVIQDAFALGTGEDNVGHMQLVAGKTYRVTFDAKASVMGEITLAIGHAGGGWTPYFVQDNIAITTAMQTFTYTFTLDAAGDFTVPAQFKLEMGMLFAGLTAPQTFILDNVKIEVMEGEAYVDAKLIENGNMNAPVPYVIEQWRYFVNFWEGTTAEMVGLAGQLVLTLTNLNAIDANWKIQIIQDAFALGTGEDNVGHMQLVAGKTYKVTFDAKASVAGDITLAIGHAGGGWTPYFVKDDIAITTEMQSFEVIFTLDAAGNFVTLAQFKLEMGNLFAGLEAPQYFVLDNVKIEVMEGEAYVDAELIVNGTMEPPVPYAIEEWRYFVNFWEGTAAEMVGIAGQLVLTLTNMNAIDANWKVQIIQDAFALGTGDDNVGHMQLVAGKTYKVTFDAKASVAGDITLAIGHASGGWTPYFVKDDIAITTEMQSFEVIFTLDAAGDFATLAQFKLEMGNLFAGLEVPQFFILDNVLISVLEGEAYVSANLIVNGNMDLILGE
jgi:hypothetical protein